jgi:DNA modification methylase
MDSAFTQMQRVLKNGKFCVSFSWIDPFMEAWPKAGFNPMGHIVFPN